MKRFVVSHVDDLDNPFRFARDHLGAKGKVDIIVKNHDESLRDAQKGLYWRWVGVISADLGYTKEELHEQYKERYLLNIYINDPDNHPDLVNVVKNMMVVKTKAPEEYPYVRKLVMNGISHLDATKENMQEYLKEVEANAISLQVRLPAPERKGLM